MSNRAAVILAAGMSSRMKTKKCKVLHEVCGRPMLAYVADACRSAGIQKLYVVVGYGADQVKERFASDPDITWVIQPEQNGTAHAVDCAREFLQDFDGDTLVLCGDGPLIRAQTLKTLIEKHEKDQSAATLATAILEDPSGYGRIWRDQYGNMQGIVEHADCTDEQLKIQEVNPSYYIFKNNVLFDAITKIEANNVKGEYYLTDAIGIIIGQGMKVEAVTAVLPEESIGVNSRLQLSEAGKLMQKRIQEAHIDSGVTIVDPHTTWIDARTTIGQDTVIEPFTYIHGEINIASNCRIGPFVHLSGKQTIADGEEVKPGTGLSLK